MTHTSLSHTYMYTKSLIHLLQITQTNYNYKLQSRIDILYYNPLPIKQKINEYSKGIREYKRYSN